MLIRAGRLIDGMGEKPLLNRYVEIAKGKILSIGLESDYPTDKVVCAEDYSSYSVLPGLIDTHVHLFLEGLSDMKERKARWLESESAMFARAVDNAKRALEKGVTSVRDLGGPGDIGVRLKAKIKNGQLSGPDIFTAGRSISTVGGHFHYAGGREASGAEDMSKAVREQASSGVDCIKLMLTGIVDFQNLGSPRVELSEDELYAAAYEARRQGKHVSVHVNGRMGVRLAVRAGLKTIEHGALIDEETVDLIGESEAFWVPTLTPFLKMWEYGRERPSKLMPEVGLEKAFMSHSMMVRRGIEKGVKIIAGTDAGALGVKHGDLWQEIELLTELGMTPNSAIASATGVAAKAIRADGKGIIAPGKDADLLVVAGDPTADIKCLQNVVQVLKSGKKVF